MIGFARTGLLGLALLAGLIATPAPAADKFFARDDLANDATRLETRLKPKAEGAGDPVRLKQAAEVAFQKSDWGSVQTLYGRLAVVEPKDPRNWTRFAVGAAMLDVADYSVRWQLRSDAHAAAYRGYLLAREPQVEAQALNVLALTYVRTEDFRVALAVLRASLKTAETPEARAQYDKLRPAHGFRVLENKIDSDAVSPRACFTFSEDLVTSGKVDYATFVAVSGLANPAISVEARQICVDGLEHGKRYGVVLRQGLPSTVGEDLMKAADYDIYVRDRSPTVRFTGRNYVLPRNGQEGLPVVAVNTPSVDVKVFRIGDRSLAPTLRNDMFLSNLDGSRTRKLADESGTQVWKGSMAITSELNKDVITAFPVLEAVGRLEPGVYVMTAKLPGKTELDDDGVEFDGWEDLATQWFVVSDLGLTAFSGDDGVDVIVRSLTDARPVKGIELRLIAKNNEVLATATTDDTGRVTFAAGLTRGSGGSAPGVVAAADGKGDYGFLDLVQSAFDLTDRGVKGRIAPKGLDAFVVTERGVYRTGETVNVTTLLRDAKGLAVPGLPLTLVVQRPDGVEYRRQAVADQGDGGRAWSLALISGVQTGTWRIKAHADPKRPPIGETTFLVADYVPERIDVTLTPVTERLRVGEPAVVDVEARHLYGAPGVDLELRGDVTVELADDTTVPGLAGYSVGLDDETFESVTKELEDLGATDEDGRARLTVAIPEAIVTRPLRAKIDVAVTEAGGRAVERLVTVPILPAGPVIGVRKLFESTALAPGGKADFALLSALPDGTRREVKGVRWELYSVTRRWQWFNTEGKWDHEVIRTSRKVADGRLDLGVGDPARLSVPVDWGDYRLELKVGDDRRPVTTVNFAVGWASSDKADAPDVLDVALDKSAYAAGENVEVRLRPRFAGTATVAVVTDRVEAMKVVDVDTAGATVSFAADPAWGAGVHVVAIAHRPLDAKAHRQPGRAVGVGWFAVDPASRRVDVALATPDLIRPRGTLKIPVKLAGLAGGEKAHVVVAAVDVGILNLTRYETPDPGRWFFGQKQLATEVRDLYGFLIDGMQGSRGAIRSGGDGGADMSAAPPREAPFARYSGVVDVGPDGTAEVVFDVPAFNGTVRVMTIAWTKDKVGHAAKEVVVRDAVVVQPTVPRFLAVGDRSRLHFALDNVEAPAGDYTLDLDIRGPIVVPAEALTAKIPLKAKGRGEFVVSVTAAGIGRASIAVRLTGPGLDATQSLLLDVQPPTTEVYRRSVKTLEPGASMTVSSDLLADFLPGTGSVSLSVAPWSALDVPALLRALDRYPHGCTEQVVSRAMPLLYVEKLAAEERLALDTGIDERLRGAIDRVLSRQDSNGSFGLWGSSGGDHLWLDAYVSDFLTRARERGLTVPQKAFDLALDRLRNQVANTSDPEPKDAADLAYAIYVLARNGRPVMGDLRYLSDQKIDLFASPLARAQLAAGLSLLGDRGRAAPVFRAAATRLKAIENERIWREDYGSPLRDAAGTMALMAESGRPLEEIMTVGLAVEAARNLRPHSSTQEQAWMVMAAASLAKETERLKAVVTHGDTVEEKTGAYYRTFRADRLDGRPVTVKIDPSVDRKLAATVVVTTSGHPITPEPAAANGYTVERFFFKPDGSKADMTKLRQTDRLVVVLRVSEPKAESARIVLVDRLPAGFEIADPKLLAGKDVPAFEWLKDSVEPMSTEYRDDRFVAAFDRSSGQDAVFEVAYGVRVVTPGRYVHPPAVVEDMYRPERYGRTAFGSIDIAPAK
ncbi:MAG: alpha-2-macroglobulin family protein [Siculibacillus sp.]|nr:alpha-2-macroglobulin family protein [Siculibacillus sp.]